MRSGGLSSLQQDERLVAIRGDCGGKEYKVSKINTARLQRSENNCIQSLHMGGRELSAIPICTGVTGHSKGKMRERDKPWLNKLREVEIAELVNVTAVRPVVSVRWQLRKLGFYLSTEAEVRPVLSDSKEWLPGP